ncbi:MAG: hypothetical protein R6X32_23920, partial [Chloroflexota bacterium]
ERDNIIQREYEEMPFLIPDRKDPRLQKILRYMEQLEALLSGPGDFYDLEKEKKQREIEQAMHQLVYELYGLHPVEQQLVEDMIEYGIGFFEWARRKTRQFGGTPAVQRPGLEMLTTYANTFRRTATAILRVKNKALNTTVYQNGAPLTVITFDLVTAAEKKETVTIVEQAGAMRTKLRQLDSLLLEQKTASMYMQRHIRVYDGQQLSLVRPSEQRFWTQSQARADADAFIAELTT